jgi:hypothetical protein
MITVYPLGTTIYDPNTCCNGYTLLGFGDKALELIDMNGKCVHSWNIMGSAYHHFKLLENGNLFLQEREGVSPGFGLNRVREYSWDGRLVWEYAPSDDIRYCGAAIRQASGNAIFVGKQPMPDEYKQRIKDPVRRGLETILSDALLEVTLEGEVIWDWHAYEHIDVNCYLESDPITPEWNWTHFNCLQSLPENRWYDEGDERFRPGNVLLSPRTLGFIFIVDKETKEIVWEYSGDYEGGLAGQHEPRMIPKGFQGTGTSLFLTTARRRFGPLDMRAVRLFSRSIL